MANKPITEDEKCKIKELYEKGYSILRIANEIGRSDGTVKKYVQEMKLVKPPRPSLVGEKFARLTVLELDYVKSRRRYWRCKCECGNVVTVSEGNLKHGITKSCGCIKKEYLQNRKKGKTTKRVKPRKNKGGVYYFQPGDIVLKGNYEVEGYKRGGEVKEFKMSPEELKKYLKELETKEVKRRGR
jgi:hypothetical protein